MAKKFIFFFCFIFLISFVSSVTLTMGPSQLDFNGVKNEVVCKVATLKGEGGLDVIGETRWADSGYSERKLTKHTLSGEKLGLHVDIPNEISFENSTDVRVCISGKKGNYHGILLYKIKNQPIQVGIWLNVSIGENDNLAVNKITGSAIDIKDSKINGVFIFPIILLVVLGLLLIRLKFKD